MKLRLVVTLSLVLFAAVSSSAATFDDTPAWVQQVTAIKAPAYEKEVTAVVLVDEMTVTIDPDGRVNEVYNYAVRILKREGREYAVARVGYLPDITKIKDFRAWLIRGTGDIKRYGKNETLDIAAVDNDIYNEFRRKGIDALNDADAGMVFAYTFSREDRSVFSQNDWAFQSSIPVINSKYTLTVPQGWRAESVTFNHPKIEPSVNGSTSTWQLSNLPPIADEPLSPNPSNLVARLAVSYYPPAGQATAIKTFTDWAAVAAWMSELEDPQVVVNDVL